MAQRLIVTFHFCALIVLRTILLMKLNDFFFGKCRAQAHLQHRAGEISQWYQFHHHNRAAFLAFSGPNLMKHLGACLGA